MGWMPRRRAYRPRRTKTALSSLGALILCFGALWSWLMSPSAPPAVTTQETVSRGPDIRLPSVADCIRLMHRREPDLNLTQIPATVIDKGILRDVPYISYRYLDVEMNIYGDPDFPAGVEMGLYGSKIGSPTAQRRAREHMSALMGEAQDRALVASLGFLKEKKFREGMTFEVTPETEEDSYGGWWISVYDEQKLIASRANQKELAEISIRKEEVARVVPQESGGESTWTRDDLKNARPERLVLNVPVTVAPKEQDRPSPTYSTGTVYVKGYTRKDGTYVRPHTRRR